MTSATWTTTKPYRELEREVTNLKQRVYRLVKSRESLMRQVELLQTTPDQEERAAMVAASEDHQLQAERFYDESVLLKAENARLRARLEEALTWQRA